MQQIEHRLLALATDAFGGYGGIAQYNRDLLNALATVPSMQRILVLPRQAPGELEAVLPVIHQVPPVQIRSEYVVSSVLAARRMRPTVVFNGHLYHGPLALRIARLMGARLVSQVHGTEIWGKLSALHRAPLEQSDLVLTVSRDTRARVLSMANMDPDRVVVLNNTVGDDFTPGNRIQARVKFGVRDSFVVLTVARLDAREGYKGHDLVIEQVAKLRREGLDICYLIGGTGDDQQRLQQLAVANGINDHVRFLGKVPREDLPDLYRAADLFALPSRGEGFGIAFLEAMACGTPAIGLAVGGAPDALGDGALGACVVERNFAPAFEKLVRGQGGDPDSLSQAARLAADRRERLSQIVHSRFGSTQFRSRVAHIFGRLGRA